MKGFSNQLVEKHRYLKDCEDELDQATLERVGSQFDNLINLQQFLAVVGLGEVTAKVCWPVAGQGQQAAAVAVIVIPCRCWLLLHTF